MTTNLATQLRNLALPSTNALRHDKKRATLLFDPKEAAAITGEVIYEIGLEGLEQLIIKSNSFEAFKDSLFHCASKTFDRNVHSKEDNIRLNKTIRIFLVTLSPYLLTNSAHKALEWLYYRYGANEFNKQDLILMALPYYNSNIFSRIVQTLKFDDSTDPFYFLRTVQKSGMHLQRLDLFYQALSNSNIIKCLTKFMKDVMNIHKHPNILTTHFHFYCTVFCGAIEFADEIRESFLSQLLPLIVKGLSSPVPDFAAASYVITAKLLAKGLLTDKLLNIFIEKISMLKCHSMKMEATLTLVLIYQLQKQYEDLPIGALDNISNNDWLVECLQYLHADGNSIYPFLRILVQKTIHYGIHENQSSARKLIIDIVNEIEFDESFTKTFLSFLLDSINEKTLKSKAEINDWISDVVKKLEQKYSLSLDLAVGEVLKDQNNTPSRKAFLRSIFESANESYTTKFQILNDLYDNKKVGPETLNSVAGLINKLESNDQYLLSNILCEKLYDKKPEVVESTLELLLRIDIEETEMMRTNLMALFKKPRLLGKKWERSYFLAANCMLRNREFTWDMFVCIFPYITLCCKRQFKQILEVFALTFFVNSKLFSKFDVASCKDSEKFMTDLLACLDNSDKELFEEFVSSVSSQTEASCISRYSTMIILSCMLPHTSLLNSSSIDQLFQVFNISSKQNMATDASTMQGYLEVALRKQIPLKGVIECMEKVIEKTVDKQLIWTTMDLSQKSGHSLFSAGLCSLALSNHLLQNVFDSYLNRISPEPNAKMLVCLNICTSGIVNEAIACRTLRYILQTLIQDKSVCLDRVASFYLLVLFLNPVNEIRTLALDLASYMTKNCKKTDANYSWLLQQLLLHKEEVIVDEEQISLICVNLLSSRNAQAGQLILKDLLKAACSGDIPIYIKAGLLKILSHINNFDMLETLCEHFLSLLGDKSSFEGHESAILRNLISRFDLPIISRILLNTSIWRFVIFILNIKEIITINLEKVYLPSLLLNQFSKDASAVASEDVLEKLLDAICEITVSSEEPEVVAISSKIFKHMDLNAKLVAHLFTSMTEVQPTRCLSARNRKVLAPTVDILDTMAWKKGVCVLEFLQGKKKIRNGQLLLPLLFDILKKCLDFEEQAAVEYPKQLTLSLILLVCSKLEEEDISEKDFNIELVIQCIRASQNPQTHYHALLALAHAAKFVPNEVLRHVMAVFTFMGSTLIRHDDAYSFEIISKIVDTIVPILVSGSHMTTITDVLRVFVNALLDVPEHRRIPLYTKLLDNINTKENFHLFLLLVLEAEVFQTSREKRKIEKGVTSQRINIALVLCQEFSPEITLHACVMVAKYLNDLPDEKDEMVQSKSSLININNYNAKQFRHYKYLIITFLSNLLSSRIFVNNIALLSDQDNINMEHLYKELIINVLAYIQRSQRVCEKAANTPQSLYWKTVLYHSYDLLDSVNDLLTPSMFLLVIRGLLMHSIHTVKKRALELLNNKLQYNLSSFKDQEKADLYGLIKPILLIIETIQQDNIQSDQETLIQTALLSLKLIVKTLGPEDPEKFVQILEFVASILNSGKARDNVLASVILCLAELCIVLRGHGISGLNSFMPAFLTILKHQKYQETSSMLLLSVITTVSKLLDSFAAFLSPYLKKLVCEVSVLISKWNCSSNDSKSQVLVARLNGLKKKISSVIAPRILIPIIEECYNTLHSKRYYNALVALIAIMEEQISSLQFADITPNMTELTNFCLKALQFRCENSSTLEAANLVEDQVVKTITVFILKLSESTFRPFYLKLYDWAVRSGASSERLISFYHLSESIGQALKGLFTLFAGNILSNLSDILRKIIDKTSIFEDTSKTILLLDYALKTLRVIFTHDNKKLINRDRFELLMQPLVDLLENDIDGIEMLVKRNEELITPTIVQFSLATADDSLWKEMNYQILLKMRNSDAQIRLIALHCLSEVVSKLREDFLPLLPETIPFLAELLEDEDERVERSCQKTIREMEKMLGEPLQKYF